MDENVVYAGERLICAEMQVILYFIEFVCCPASLPFLYLFVSQQPKQRTGVVEKLSRRAFPFNAPRCVRHYGSVVLTIFNHYLNISCVATFFLRFAF
ncbi:MAG: hypothetical protein IPL35_15005 [Sphingobacteriales bacterium]|nr:hypothetical protein [Sphingobacteriales bacterium]